jgi:hypothetical protein
MPTNTAKSVGLIDKLSASFEAALRTGDGVEPVALGQVLVG